MSDTKQEPSRIINCWSNSQKISARYRDIINHWSAYLPYLKTRETATSSLSIFPFSPQFPPKKLIFIMGIFLSRLFQSLFGSKEVRILILGLDNAGKTTILCKCWLELIFEWSRTMSSIRLHKFDSICLQKSYMWTNIDGSCVNCMNSYILVCFRLDLILSRFKANVSLRIVWYNLS